MSPTPLVIFIDIDGTLIGDVTPQVCEWELIMSHDPSKLPCFRTHLLEVLRVGLLRPNIADFLSSFKDTRVEFFIFTASDTHWANFLVPCIEKTIDFKFNRPIFTRSQCISSNKSIDKVLPAVAKKLKCKYPSISEKALKERVAIIDNNNVLIENEMHRCINCPTYDFTYYYDVLSRFDIKTLSLRYNEMATVLYHHGLFPFLPTFGMNMSFSKFRSLYYKMIAKSIIQASTKGKSSRNQTDDIWMKMMHVMKTRDLVNLSDSTIASINRSMRKMLKR
jgi:hypothetical protein